MFAPSSRVCRQCLRSATRHYLHQFFRKASTRKASTAIAGVDGYVPPILLSRARKLAAEHDQLAMALETDFDTETAKRAGELLGIATALKEWERAGESMEELRSLVKDGDAEMRALAEDELQATTEELEASAHKLSVALTPRDPYADMPCIIEIVAGPGGMEGRFFADTLFRMYQLYCSRNGFRSRVVSYTVSDTSDNENALQEAILEISNAGAYDAFRGEAGMHRVQRVPITENSGRTHTSAVAVWVLPSFPDNSGGAATDFTDPTSDFYIDVTEVKSEVMKARGAGGQHVNTTESAVRLTHRPTGTVVSMQDHRSQHRNREEAWKLLRSRVAQVRREQREEEARKLRTSVLSKDRITRSDKIRTYNYTQGRCTDHRSGLDVHDLPDVLKGGEMLSKLIASVREWLTARDVLAVIAEEESKAAAAAKTEAKGKKS